MSKYSLFFLIGLIGGFLIGTTSVYADTRAIGPQPIIPTDIAKGTLFVKPNGSGNICSMANPCNIETAIGKASAGDVVFLRGGTYKTNGFNISSSGRSENPIIYESYPGELAVFDGSHHPDGSWQSILLKGSFVQIRNIEFKGWPRHGIEINGNDNLIEGVHAHHNRLAGIKVWSPVNADDSKATRNIIKNCTANDNSGVGVLPFEIYANGGNSDGISIANGFDNRVENNLVYHNSDDGIDSNRARRSYIGYNIVHSNGFGEGNGSGIKGGGFSPPSFGGFVEHNISYSNSGPGLNNNTGNDVTFKNNTTWNNKASIKTDPDTVTENTLSYEKRRFGKPGIEINNSWQRSGSVAFISTDPKSSNFLMPTSDGGFEDIGAYVNATNTASDNTSSLPDVVVTQISYADGIFTSTVKNQGNAATPEGVAVAVGYSVDGKYKTWGGIQGPLAAGASVTIGTKSGKEYIIPDGTHTITAWVDDVNRFSESNENNNQLSQSITMR